MQTLRIFAGRTRGFWLLTWLFLSGTTQAHAQKTLVLDDFENGVGAWTRNDKTKSDNPSAGVVLVDILATRPASGGMAGSQGAGLFTFKAANKAWASASLKIDGAQLAKMGARGLKFWLNADGQTPGVEIMLRGIARNPDGSTRDVVYELPVDKATKKPKTVKLTTKNWREVAIPLSDFKSKGGGLATRALSSLYLLQFVQRGTWNSRFFTLDDIRVQGTGILVGPVATPTPKPTAVPAVRPVSTVDPDAIPVEIDFLKSQGRIRASANVSVGTKWPSPDGTLSRPLEDSRDFRAALKTLAPRFVRLDAGALVELLDSSRPAFDFTRLSGAVNGVRSIGAEPLVSLPVPAAWGLDERAYAAFVTQTARALNTRAAKPVRYWELATGTLPTASAVAYYSRGYLTLKTLSKSARVGGVNSSNVPTLNALFKSARGLDFLSIPFYGANSGTPDAAVLLNATLSLPSLRAAANALDASRFKSAPLYISNANLNGARNADDFTPTDARLSSIVAGAWWASLLGNGSRLADQIFHNDAANPEWGLLNDRASAYPAYYAMWMWNTFLPTGSVRVQHKITGAPRGLQITAVNTPTSHNAFLVNTGATEIKTRLTIRGFPILRQARMRVLQDPLDPTTGVRFVELPKSPFQNITLPPYAVAVLQFIEPPRLVRPRTNR